MVRKPEEIVSGPLPLPVVIADECVPHITRNIPKALEQFCRCVILASQHAGRTIATGKDVELVVALLRLGRLEVLTHHKPSPIISSQDVSFAFKQLDFAGDNGAVLFISQVFDFFLTLLLNRAAQLAGPPLPKNVVTIHLEHLLKECEKLPWPFDWF